MREFDLRILTPDGVAFEGKAESIVIRTIDGDVCILYGHIDYIAVIEFGRVKIKQKGSERYAACMGGFVSVSKGEVRIVATTFEYADEIDEKRAKEAKAKAEQRLTAAESERETNLAKLKLYRALNRIDVSKLK